MSRRGSWALSGGCCIAGHHLALREVSKRTDDVSGGPWKPPLTGKLLSTAFRALFSPKGKKMGNAEILQTALKTLTSRFPSSNLNKCVCFYIGYWGNDLAVQVAASHYGSNWRLWGRGVYLDVVEREPTQRQSPYLGSDRFLLAADRSITFLKISFYVFP